MRFRSVCSGIEAASVAWNPLGWECVELAEIDRFPSAVLKYRYPEVPNVGDFTQIRKRPQRDVPTADLLVGGTPCQSFSVAGLRAGMDDERGQLALEFLRLASATRPRWIVWENVPGVLSSGGGRDFGSFLGGLAELGYGCSYRILDAQYAGVPQRRRRVFVVGYLGDWRPAAAVLFERHSLSGNPPPGQKTKQDPAGGVARSLRARSNLAHRDDADTLIPEVSHCPNAGGMRRQDYETETMIPVAYQCHGSNVGPMGVIRAGNGNETGGVPFIACTLPASNGGASSEYQPVVFSPQASGKQTSLGLSKTPGTVKTSTQQAVACFDPRNVTSQANRTRVEYGQPSNTLHQQGLSVITPSAFRRLTPRESERLQGFPDDWTLVPYRGKLAADGPRYKAVGNSIAVPVLRWIGQRIMTVGV